MSTQTITAQVTPFVSSTEVKCYAGVDYIEALGNALHFTCSTWTNLASGTVNVRNLLDAVVVTGTVVTAAEAGTEQEVYFELNQETLSSLGKGRHNLRMIATLSGYECLLHDFWITVI